MTDAGPQAAEREPWTIYGQPVRGRSCGSCTLCCTLVPVELPSGPKPANARCPHLCSKGCCIYARRPDPCRYWSCRWLFDPATAGLRRPDRSGVVIDPTLDTILAEGRPLDVLQVWCDPNRRDAHRDPAVRAYLADVARRTGMVSIVRWDSEDGVILVPPGLSDSGEWLELGGAMCSEAEMRGRLNDAGAQHAMRRPGLKLRVTP